MPVESSIDQIDKRYILHELLGQGGMGSVYRATDRLIVQDIALKRVLAQSHEPSEMLDTDDEVDFRLILAQEFKLSSSLRHPNIVEVLDYGFDLQNQPYFTMELLKNHQDLLTYGQDRPLSEQVDLLLQTLYALTYLHRRGVIHRDLKPANIAVVDGVVKVLDFGLSTIQQEQEEENAPAGTLAYMAPEVIIGHPPTILSDLYAIGVIGYELFSGESPFDTKNPGKLVNDILFAIPNMSNLDIDENLKPILSTLLEKEPQARYNTADEVIRELSQAVDSVLTINESEIRESYLHSARLVGREKELEQLTAALDLTEYGYGASWLIAGESGVGKSRLIDELRTLAMVQGALVLRGQALRVGSRPYEMWRSIFRWIGLLAENLSDNEIALLKPYVPEIQTFIGNERDVADLADLRPSELQKQLLDLLVKTLQQQNRRTVVLLEDIHLAGSESLQLLQLLSEKVYELPLLIIGTYRSDEGADIPAKLPDISRLELERLSENQIAELSEAMLGDAGKSQQVLNLLQRETEGNIYYIIEVMRALIEEFDEITDIGTRTLPNTIFAGGINNLLKRRLKLIPEKHQLLLQLAALIGREIDVDLLKQIAPNEDLQGFLTDALNAGVLIVEDQRWSFTNEKLRDAVIAEIDGTIEKQLHEKIALGMEDELTETTARLSALAHHWAEAGNTKKEEQYLVLAGTQELKHGAYNEAIHCFHRALDLIPQNIQPELERLERQFFLRNRIAEAHLGMGNYHNARVLYEENHKVAEKWHDSELTANSLRNLGQVAQALGELDKAQELYQQSLDLYRELNEQSAIADLLNYLGNVADEMGNQDEALNLYQESLNISRNIGGNWGMAGAVQQQQKVDKDASSEYQEAKKDLQETLKSHEEQNNKHGLADTYYDLGYIAQNMQEFADATQYYQEAITLRQSLDDQIGTAQAYERLGEIATQNNDYQTAESNFQQALKLAHQLNETTFILYLLIAIARLYIAQDKQERAIEILSFILANAEDNEKLQDQSEDVVFKVEETLDPNILQAAWEKGKNISFTDMVNSLTTT